MSLYRPDEEKHFAKLLVECCLVLEEDLESCRKRLLSERELGSDKLLADLLIEEGMLTPFLAKKVARRMQFFDVFCCDCRRRFQIEAADLKETKVYECPDCGHRMSRTRYRKTILSGMVIDRPQYLTDRVFQKMLGKTGLVDGKEIERCLEIQKTREPRRELARIFVDESLLSLNQVRKIFRVLSKTICERYPYLEKMKRDVKLAKMLARRGVLPINRINACLAEQVRVEKETGEFFRLRGLLVEHGYLSSYQIETALPIAADQVSGLDTLVEDSDEASFDIDPEETVGLEDESDVSAEEGSDSSGRLAGVVEESEESAKAAMDEDRDVIEESKLPLDEPIEIDKEESIGSGMEVDDLFDESDGEGFLRSTEDETFLVDSEDESGEIFDGEGASDGDLEAAEFSQMATKIDSDSSDLEATPEKPSEGKGDADARASDGASGGSDRRRRSSSRRRSARRSLSKEKREEITSRIARRRGRRRRS